MIQTRLILVDGMTGAGKSTTAQRLALHLEDEGQAARWIYEHDTAHPIWRPGEQERMAEAGALEAGFLEETLPVRWQELATACAASDGVTILESTLLQTTVGFLLAMNVAEPRIVAHVADVAARIAAPAPVLVYLRHGDVAAGLRATFVQREAHDYARNLATLIGRTPYGQANGVQDEAGLVRFYELWRDVVDRIFTRLDMGRLAVELGTGDWASRERQLTDFLDLPPMRMPRRPVPDPARFIGRYRDAASDDELVVAGDEAELHLGSAHPTLLLPRPDGSFRLEAVPVEVAFGEERDGRFQRLEVRGSLPGLHPLWTRVAEAAGAGQ